MSVKSDIKENALLREAVKKPPGNYVLIIGGKRAAEKIAYISKFIDKTKKILIGGAIAKTFLAARGENVGNSKIEEDCFAQCRAVLQMAKEKNVNIILPVDHIAAIRIEPEVTIKMITHDERIPDNMMGLDIGFDTIKLFSEEIEGAELIVWYGPLGVYEIDTFAAGTSKIAEAVADSPATTILIGKDLIAAARKAGVADRFSYTTSESTAALAYLIEN